MQKLIIDTDPGVDDAQAILLALAYPGVSVEAITTVNGNVSLEHTTANALKILNAAGVDVPVYAGCSVPLINEPRHEPSVHGQDGLGDCDLPRSNRRVEDEHAANLLVRKAREHPGEITLVCIGPLTNIALALRLDPQLPENFQKIVIMGGAHHSRGNTANFTAEFNFFADPEAAAMVLSAWKKATLITWETTLAHRLVEADLQRIYGLDTEKSRFFEKTSRVIRRFIRDRLGQEGLFTADALAMAVAIEPQVVRKSEVGYATVECSGSLTRGQLCVDWLGLTQRAPNAEIVLEIDQARYVDLFVNGFR
jgi:purine nucleosidase